MDVLRKLLVIAIEMIDNGECTDFSEEEIEQISVLIHRPKIYGREDAAKYLGICLNKFHEYRKQGIISEPKKVVGMKELHYYKSDLDNAIKIIRLTR